MSSSSQLGESFRTVESEESVPNTVNSPKEVTTSSSKGTPNNIIANRFQTRWCKSTQVGRQCPYGHRCMFAHSPEELRTVEMNLRDGITSEIAIKAFRRRQREAKLRGQPFPGSSHPAPVPTAMIVQQQYHPGTTVIGGRGSALQQQQPAMMMPPTNFQHGQAVPSPMVTPTRSSIQVTPTRGRSGSFASSLGDFQGSRRSGSEDRFSSSAGSVGGSATFVAAAAPQPQARATETFDRQSSAAHSIRSDSPLHSTRNNTSGSHFGEQDSMEERQSFSSFLAWNNCQGTPTPNQSKTKDSPRSTQPHRQPTKKVPVDPESSDTSGSGGDSGESRSNQGLSAEGGPSNSSSSSTGGNTPHLNNRRNQSLFQKMFPPWTHTPYPTVQWVYNPNCDCELCRSQRSS